MSTKTHATIKDLYHVPENGKAEIVNGELRLMAPTGDLPNSSAFEIAVSLRAHARRSGVGRAYTDNAAFIVNWPNRRSFSPDAAYYVGPRTSGKFLEGAPSWPWKCAPKATTVRRLVAQVKKYGGLSSSAAW